MLNEQLDAQQTSSIFHNPPCICKTAKKQTSIFETLTCYRASGAYIFRPSDDNTARALKPLTDYKAFEGELYVEIHQEFEMNVSQVRKFIVLLEIYQALL